MKRCLLTLLFGLIIGNFGLATTAIDGETRNTIAFVGKDYNIYSYEFSNQKSHQITDNANARRHYQWPTWSNDGRLAYFCCDLSVARSPRDAEVFISSNGLDSGVLAYEGQNEAIVYAYWSPASCGENCRDLALLVNDENGLALEMLRDGDNASHERIADGSPFYYHWNASGTQLVFHRNNQQLDIYNRDQNDFTVSYETMSSGLFQAPDWSPIDERVLLSSTGTAPGLTNLSILENGELQILVADIHGFLSFLWSPDGRYIAYRSLDQTGLSVLQLIDANTGESLMSSDVEGVVSFFWSPDSRKIAYLTLEEGRERDAFANPQFVSLDLIQNNSPTNLSWSILEIETGGNLSYSAFTPSSEMVYLLSYFDQFAPSHRLWSPDSRYLLYSGIENDRTFVIALDTETGLVTNLFEGLFAVWSFR